MVSNQLGLYCPLLRSRRVFWLWRITLRYSLEDERKPYVAYDEEYKCFVARGHYAVGFGKTEAEAVEDWQMFGLIMENRRARHERD